MWYGALVVTTAVALIGAAANATDGDFRDSYCSGAWCVQEYFLCDGDHTANDCAEIDLHSEVSGGLPEYVVVSLRNHDAACAAEVTIRALAQPLGMPGVVGTLSLAGVSAFPINPQGFRFIDGTVGTPANCTDLEVVVALWYPHPEAH